VVAADEPFLFRVFAASRADELAVVPWSTEQKIAFLRQQFDAQDREYRTQYPDAEFLVVELDGEAIGRLYVNRGSGELHILDVALLPGWRRRGVGRRLLEDAMAEARAKDAFVSLYVETHNPARRLYDMLGFALVEEGPVYDRLEWRPAERARAC
jgi:ribosomal protein S18 acetylase RimI-like enzyme